MSKEYKRNYISNFLIRLDLETNLEEGNYEKLISILNENFPLKEKHDIENRKITIDTKDKNNPKPILSSPEIKIQNILYNTSKNERITINSDSIIYESLNYKSYSIVKPILEKIINSLNKDYGIKNFNRIGLRYVNMIKFPVKSRDEIFNWNGYINEKIIFNNGFVDNKNLLQEVKTIDFKLDEENELLCRLQTGIPNRNMPANLMEKIYLIDIDGYTNSMVEQESAIQILDTIHDKNIEIFEKCIGDNLRRDMDE